MVLPSCCWLAPVDLGSLGGHSLTCRLSHHPGILRFNLSLLRNVPFLPQQKRRLKKKKQVSLLFCEKASNGFHPEFSPPQKDLCNSCALNRRIVPRGPWDLLQILLGTLFVKPSSEPTQDLSRACANGLPCEGSWKSTAWLRFLTDHLLTLLDRPTILTTWLGPIQLTTAICCVAVYM